MIEPAEHPIDFEALLSSERARLVRLCAYLAGNHEAAEDLAQETLYEAWRNMHKLNDPSGIRPWLSAIARNVCLRWRSNSVRVVSSFTAPGPDDWADGDSDVEFELEQQDLANLLDRALGLLPPETRSILVSHYVNELPQSEIAAVFGLTEGAIKMRLRRGKLALRRVLATDLADEANACEILDPAADGWRETSIWCPLCGQHRLIAHIDREQGDFLLRCPTCYPSFGLHQMKVPSQWRLFDDVRAIKAIVRRVTRAANTYYHTAIVKHTALCLTCGNQALVELRLPPEVLPRTREGLGVHTRCPACGDYSYTSLGGLVLANPEAQRFWHDHPRIQTVPETEVEVDGRPSLVTTFMSVTDDAQLSVISDRDTLKVLHIHRRDGTPG